MAFFDAKSYREFRPLYPSATFDHLLTHWVENRRNPYRLADLATGTGQSLVSLLRAIPNENLAIETIAIDSDPLMLEAASLLAEPRAHGTRFVEGRAEKIPLADQSLDAITIGSALHWMDLARAVDEFGRVLKPGGLLLAFEYQFPKAEAARELNEWIRREFDLRWKAPGQKPRGNFVEVSEPIRRDPRFEDLGACKVPMIQSLGARELFGFVLSQSRYLHYERALPEDTIPAYREELQRRIEELLPTPDRFDFKLQSMGFRKRSADG